MGTKTIETCDRCGHTQEAYSKNYKQMEGVRLNLTRYSTEVASALWCVNCLVELHIYVPRPGVEAKPIEPAPTLEDLIRQIVQDTIDNQ